MTKLPNIHCTVCAIPLGPQCQDGTEQQITANEEAVPFVALTCQGRCRVEEANDTTAEENGAAYYCVPGCWEHFLKYQWGLYSGLGQAHKSFSRGLLGNCGDCRSDLVLVEDHPKLKGSLSLEESLTRVSPQILAKGFSIFQSSTIEKLDQEKTVETHPSASDDDKGADDQDATIRRITQELEDIRILKCPSCQYKIGISEDRGCDAAWCEHCGRAFCLFCLTDCGDNPKTDDTANSTRLIGDAHDHVLNNDCGLTAGKGSVHSGKTLSRYHEQQFLKKVVLRLKRVPEPIRDQVCRNLVIRQEVYEEVADASAEASKRHSLVKLRREIENDKWEPYSEEQRIDFLHGAWKGDVPMVQCLLEAGVPCNIPDSEGGESALHFAAIKGHVHVVRLLLEHGANPWQLSPSGRTPLDDLCNMESSCDLETARYLVRACMLGVPGIYANKKVVFPWLRPWPNGTTAAASAKKYYSDSPVNDYFRALQDYSYKLCKACAYGETDQVEKLLSNCTDTFPQPNAGEMEQLPPAQDLIWIYNHGSGCTPLLDVCAKSVKLSPQHVMASVKMILKAARSLDDNNDNNNTTVRRLLQMREFKFNATVLHWLAIDPKPQMLKLAGLFLQYAGKALSQAVDKRGETPLDWARKYAMEGERDDRPEEHQKHIERWEGIILSWEDMY